MLCFFSLWRKHKETQSFNPSGWRPVSPTCIHHFVTLHSLLYVLNFTSSTLYLSLKFFSFFIFTVVTLHSFTFGERVKTLNHCCMIMMILIILYVIMYWDVCDCSFILWSDVCNLWYLQTMKIFVLLSFWTTSPRWKTTCK